MSEWSGCPYCLHRMTTGVTVHVAANVCGQVPADAVPPLPFDGRKARESVWRKLVTDVAKAAGWQVQHVRSVQDRSGQWVNPCSLAGWPDLVLIRPPRMLAVELKAHGGKATPAQVALLADMRTIPGCSALVAKPRDWHRLVPLLR